jgi:hypothetical protein
MLPTVRKENVCSLFWLADARARASRVAERAARRARPGRVRWERHVLNALFPKLKAGEYGKMYGALQKSLQQAAARALHSHSVADQQSSASRRAHYVQRAGLGPEWDCRDGDTSDWVTSKPEPAACGNPAAAVCV